MEPIRIVGMNRVWGLASPSPFVLKLATWLKFQDIPYRGVALTRPPQSKTGKIPYLLRDDGSMLADSSIIIETLARERGIDLAAGLTPEEQARAHVITRTLEESLYFAAVWERWLHPECWPITRKSYFGSRRLIPWLIRRQIRAALHGQGTGRHEPAHIAALGAADIAAISLLLGERLYFCGERPTVVDATAYGFLANLLAFPARTPLQQAVEANPNLVAFCQRIKERYWSERAGSTDRAATDKKTA